MFLLLVSSGKRSFSWASILLRATELRSHRSGWWNVFSCQKRQNLLWNFTACVTVVAFRVLRASWTFLRPWFCFIALATAHNATQTPLTVWVRIFSQCLCARARSYQKWNLGLVFEKRLVGSHIASEGKPYCVTQLASGLRSLPLVTLAGAWTQRGPLLVYRTAQPGRKLFIIIFIVSLPFVLIRNIAAAYLRVKKHPPRVRLAFEMFPSNPWLSKQLVIIGCADEIQVDLFSFCLPLKHSAPLTSLLQKQLTQTHIHTLPYCFHAVRYILKRDLWARCELKIFNNLINLFQTTHTWRRLSLQRWQLFHYFYWTACSPTAPRASS